MEKVLIIIGSPLQLRNYISTSAFSEINNKYHCKIAIPESVSKYAKNYKLKDFLVFIEDNNSKYSYLIDVLTWKFRKKSKTFFFRHLRTKLGLYGTINIITFLFVLYRIIKNIPFYIEASIIIPKSWFGKKWNNIPINSNLENLVNLVKPDLIIYPTSAVEDIGYDLLKISKKLSIKTLFIIDNWDNLSSKSVFWEKPDFLIVWGQQSKEHAIEIHEFSEDSIFIAGTPRFDVYKKKLSNNVKKKGSKYILFLGCAIPFDELTTLKLLDEIVNKYNINNKDKIKVVYRPHPWRQHRKCDDIFLVKDYKNVELDVQIKNSYYNGADEFFQPDLNYYPKLLYNAELTICPLTTMLIESLLCETKVLALTYSDGVHFTNPRNAYKNYKHFEGIDKIKNLHFCDNIHQLESEFYITIKKNIVDQSIVLESLNYFISNNHGNFPRMLNHILGSISDSLGRNN